MGSRLAGLVRGFVRLVDDSGQTQRFQVEAQGEPIPDVDHLQPYGLTAVPPLGARTLLATVGRAFDHVVALVTGHTDRPTGLAPGDVTLYSAHASRLDLRATGALLKGLRLLIETGHVDSANGYRTAGAAGLTGTLTIRGTPPLPAPPVPVVILTARFAGGIITEIIPGAPWVVVVGGVLDMAWS
jgi:hypothetical protein